MRITICYPSEKPIPPPLYGGGQRVMYWLAKALVQLGHQVTLIAHPDSHVPGVELRPFLSSDSNAKDESWVRLIPDSTDVLHFRHRPCANPPKPFVVTVGGNGRLGETYSPNTIFVSRQHAANHGSVHYVHNGIDPSEYECSSKREDYAVFLAKASWSVKNLSGAIQVCRRAGIELRVIGSRSWPFELQRFLPAIRGVRYCGMLGQKEKVPLLSRARCLVFPVRWHEPFASAVNEALASGCYVVGTPYGCMPEVITPETGRLSSRADDLADAVRNPSAFKPEASRQRLSEGGFTNLAMAKKYLKYYEKVVADGRLGERDEPPPRTADGFIANQLLPWEE
jgi:glycosyltransferase involved in cell wall biosynthesis